MSIARSTADAVLQRGPPEWRPTNSEYERARLAAEVARGQAIDLADDVLAPPPRVSRSVSPLSHRASVFDAGDQAADSPHSRPSIDDVFALRGRGPSPSPTPTAPPPAVPFAPRQRRFSGTGYYSDDRGIIRKREVTTRSRSHPHRRRPRSTPPVPPGSPPASPSFDPRGVADDHG